MRSFKDGSVNWRGPGCKNKKVAGEGFEPGTKKVVVQARTPVSTGTSINYMIRVCC